MMIAGDLRKLDGVDGRPPRRLFLILKIKSPPGFLENGLGPEKPF